MRWPTILGSGLLLAVIAVVGAMSLRNGTPVETAKAVVGEVRQYVDERGKTRLPTQKIHHITMPFAARVRQIQVVEGQRVDRDDELVRIVSEDVDYAVEEAQAVVDRLSAAIDETTDSTVETTTKKQAIEFLNSMVKTVAAAEERKTSGRARRDYAERNFARVKQGFDENARSEDELERAQVGAVEADVNYRQDVLVWEAMKSIEAATRLLPDMVQQYIDRKSLSEAVLNKQRAEAVARLQQVETRQKRSVMTSPIDGVVLERPVSNRRDLPAGELLMTVGALADLEVETDVLSQDVVDVRPGQPAAIYGPAVGRHAENAIDGIVLRVHPAGFTKVSSLGVEQQRVKVVVGFRDPEVLRQLVEENGLGVDYRVRVRIFTAAEDKAIVVPRSALFRAPDDSWRVFAVRGGKAKLTRVEVGLMNDRQAEVTDGLAENESVVLAPETNLESGTRVVSASRD
jgi:HlyD family secretion protein